MPIWTSFFSWFRIWRQKCGSRITVWRPIKYRTFHHESLSAWRCLVNCDCNTMKTDDQELMDKLSIDRFWLGLFKKPWTKHKLILMLGCHKFHDTWGHLQQMICCHFAGRYKWLFCTIYQKSGVMEGYAKKCGLFSWISFFRKLFFDVQKCKKSSSFLELQAEFKSNNCGFSTLFRQKLYEWD